MPDNWYFNELQRSDEEERRAKIASQTQPPADQLLELAERCEAATGPDRELDLAIANASYELGFPIWGAKVNYDPALWLERYGPITTSLDAAMTLVPEGWSVNLIRTADKRIGNANLYWFRGGNSIPAKKMHGAAPTLELSLCAAAFRARASQGDSYDH